LVARRCHHQGVRIRFMFGEIDLQIRKVQQVRDRRGPSQYSTPADMLRGFKVVR